MMLGALKRGLAVAGQSRSVLQNRKSNVKKNCNNNNVNENMVGFMFANGPVEQLQQKRNRVTTKGFSRKAVADKKRKKEKKMKIIPQQQTRPMSKDTSSGETSESRPRMERANSYKAETQGMGSAVIHGMYSHLGRDVQDPPFLGVPKTVNLIGCPMSWGQPRAGTDHGSEILRETGLEGTLIDLGWRIDDSGDLEFDPPARTDPQLDRELGNAKNCFCVGKGLEKIHHAVYAAATKDEFPLILGGDHSISAGSVSAILKARPETGIIWVDAHADLNTPASSPSGNMHGMPLGLLMKLIDPAKLPGFEWMADIPPLAPEKLVYIGLRDLDDEEINVIKDYNIAAFTMHEVDRYGIGGTMDRALSHLRHVNGGELPPLHMSLDVDACDPQIASATGTVVRGGLSYRESHFVTEEVSNTGMLGSLDLVEVNPKLTTDEESKETAALGVALIASALGARIL